MKKVLSILSAFLIIISVMHISIATHYCGSDHATYEKVSLTGQLASCGMEDSDEKCSEPGIHFEEPCCDDEVAVLAVDDNYAPSFTNFTTLEQHLLQVYFIPVNVNVLSLTTISQISTSISPLGNFWVHAVSLPKICAFLN